VIASIGVVTIPVLEGVIKVVEDGVLHGMVKIPMIVIGLMLGYFLNVGRSWAYWGATIYLSITVFIVGSSSIYLGIHSFYPSWKIAVLYIMVLIAIISLICIYFSKQSGGSHPA
jgi:hypothetical protein